MNDGDTEENRTLLPTPPQRNHSLTDHSLDLVFPLHTYFVPRVSDDLGRVFAKQFLGYLGGDVGELDKSAPGRHTTAGHGLPPDLARLLPRVTAKGGGGEVKCLVRNAAIQVDTTVILGNGLVIGHVGRLGVFTL